jgi:hypothetical protein
MLEFSTLLLLLVSYFIHQIISKEVIKLYTKSWDKLGSYNVLLKNNYSIKCFILNIIYACAYINRSIVGPKEGGGREINKIITEIERFIILLLNTFIIYVYNNHFFYSYITY